MLIIYVTMYRLVFNEPEVSMIKIFQDFLFWRGYRFPRAPKKGRKKKRGKR